MQRTILNHTQKAMSELYKNQILTKVVIPISELKVNEPFRILGDKVPMRYIAKKIIKKKYSEVIYECERDRIKKCDLIYFIFFDENTELILGPNNTGVIREIPHWAFGDYTNVEVKRLVDKPVYVRNKKPLITEQALKPSKRFDILYRDGFRCQICGRASKDGVLLEVDHKHPRAKGGTDDINNLWTLCFDCNRGKRDKIIEFSAIQNINP